MTAAFNAVMSNPKQPFTVGGTRSNAEQREGRRVESGGLQWICPQDEARDSAIQLDPPVEDIRTQPRHYILLASFVCSMMFAFMN